MAGESDDEGPIRDQITFYRTQAPDYSQAPGADDDQVLARCPPSDHCLELASGSGRWTRQLLRFCSRITAVDASPEMHARNRALNGDSRVDYVLADLFDFVPPAGCDLVFAAFWLSHIPPERFSSFWHMVGAALGSDGRVVMVDDGIEGSDGEPRFASDASGDGPARRAADGRDFTIVKVAYAPTRLESLLADLGWTATVTPLTPVAYVLEAQRS